MCKQIYSLRYFLCVAWHWTHDHCVEGLMKGDLGLVKLSIEKIEDNLNAAHVMRDVRIEKCQIRCSGHYISKHSRNKLDK